MDKESRTGNTNNYKVMGIVLLILSVLTGIIFFKYEMSLYGIIAIISGILLYFTVIFVYSICYRLDLIIDKK